jgi:hypothetical protein
MLPSPERFLEGFAFFARRHAPLTQMSEAAIVEALDEAEHLAEGNPQNEPAALFYACATRSRAFGTLGREFIPFITRRHAHTIGVQLVVEDVVLDILRARIVLGAVTFDDVRAELAKRSSA